METVFILQFLEKDERFLELFLNLGTHQDLTLPSELRWYYYLLKWNKICCFYHQYNSTEIYTKKINCKYYNLSKFLCYNQLKYKLHLIRTFDLKNTDKLKIKNTVHQKNRIIKATLTLCINHFYWTHTLTHVDTLKLYDKITNRP